MVSGSCRAELAEEAREGPDAPLDSRPWSSNLKDVQEVRRTSDLEIGEGVPKTGQRGSAEIVAGIEAMAIQS